ncbi:AfsR/SARP family transcriptional regulator [Asanoa siamensis]|uniref:SARP family transcriptional regulator n=1 Tax=Asanoa siamensis TaxID=926357 RepID=A0ABQ4D1N6_9ACTN|nr:AfsR/SARP family transcriptional regulator [Asanoa siamensis]GIF77447.1 SARP family transcriptional regulator [Asanoa siamensis]
MARVQFKLLGPLEVRVDDQLLQIGSPKHRILLASLLLEPGRTVGTAELIEAIWGAAPPDNQRSALQVCVARTRALLEKTLGSSLISTERDGYRIDVDPDTVDVQVFQAWLSQARQRAAASDDDGEARALAQALTLWRGEALADIPSDALHAQCGQMLIEHRLRAAERQIDLQLRAGRHVDVVSELTTLAARNPLREKLWLQLMTALDRCGRRAEALTTFHTARRRLADEIGIQPGDDLQQLYLRILRGGSGPSEGGPSAPPVPRQLPTEVTGFAGRAMHLRQLNGVLERHERDLTDRSTVLILNGMAGVGKTALAAHWARSVADHFPDGQLWLNLRGYDYRDALAPQQALTFVLRSLGVPGAKLPPDLEGQAALYRTITDGRRLLIVLDNAAASDQIRSLLPGGVGHFVLVTGRNEFSGLVVGEGATTVGLELFTTDEARQMLRSRIGHRKIAAELDVADRVIERCGRLPLALAIAAARAVARPAFPLSVLERQLADTPNDLDAFSGPDIDTDVRAVFSWSYRRLAAPAARLFRLLGLHPAADVSTAAAASLAGLTAQQVRPLLETLAAAHLVVEHQPERFVLHDLLQAYGQELALALEPPAERAAAQRRLLEWMTRSAFMGRPLLQPSESQVELPTVSDGVEPVRFTGERDAREWFEAERRVLVGGVHLAETTGSDDLCWRLAYAIWVHLQLTGAWDDLFTTHQAGLRAAERIGDQLGLIHMHSGVGNIQRVTGQSREAIRTHRAALTIARATAEELSIAMVLNNLGAAHRDAGDLDQALTCFRESCRLQEGNGRRGNLAITRYQIGLTLTAAGRIAEAIPALSRARRAFQGLGHRRADARTAQALAAAYELVEQYHEAARHHGSAAAVYRDLGDRCYEAAALTQLGHAYRRSGQNERCRDAWQRARAIYEELGSHEAHVVGVHLEHVQKDAA